MRMWDQLYDNAIEVGENTDFHRFHSTISVLPVVGQENDFLIVFLDRIKETRERIYYA